MLIKKNSVKSISTISQVKDDCNIEESALTLSPLISRKTRNFSRTAWRTITMIDEALERMCQFNDQEIRRKGKLLMAKVGRRRGRCAGPLPSQLQSAHEQDNYI